MLDGLRHRCALIAVNDGKSVSSSKSIKFLAEAFELAAEEGVKLPLLLLLVLTLLVENEPLPTVSNPPLPVVEEAVVVDGSSVTESALASILVGGFLPLGPFARL